MRIIALMLVMLLPACHVTRHPPPDPYEMLNQGLQMTQNNPDGAINMVRQALEIFKRRNEDFSIGRSFFAIGNAYKFKNDMASACKYYHSAEDMFVQVHAINPGYVLDPYSGQDFLKLVRNIMRNDKCPKEAEPVAETIEYYGDE